MPEVPHDLSFKIAKVLSESDTPQTLLSGALQLLGEALDWDFGNLWRVDYENIQMLCAASWTRRGKSFPNFQSLSKIRKLLHGEGIPGTVWKERGYLWIEEVDDASVFPRLNIASAEGICSAAAVSIIIQKRVIGAIEFFSDHLRAKDESVLVAMASAGTQIGAYLERLRLEEGVTGARADFELLAEKSFDAIITIDEHSTILFANSALTSIFGYDRDQIIGKNMTELIPARLRPQHEAGMRRYLQSGKKNISWDGIVLPGLHRSGIEFLVEIRFGELRQAGRRLFTGYMRPLPKT